MAVRWCGKYLGMRPIPVALWACVLGALAPPLAAQPMVFAFSELPPWKTVDGQQLGGAYTEIVRELARRTNTPLEIFQCPIKRCLVMMQDGGRT